MEKKLILTIEETLIEKATQYAQEKGVSLSNIITDYLNVMISEGLNRESELTLASNSKNEPIEAPDNKDYKKELTKKISEKYYFSE